MTRRKKRNKSRILAFCAAVAFLAAVVLFAKFLRAYIDDRLVLKEQNDLRDMFENGASSMGSFLFPTAHAEEADENQPAARFAELYKINPDIIGWIAAGSEISTPVVYRDNSYYMDHDFYGKSSAEGTVFADEFNVEWQTDPYVILYGHNMKNGSMFGNMDRYMDLDYFKANTTVSLYALYSDDPDYYVPFAAVDASMSKDHDSYFYLRRFSAFMPWLSEDASPDPTPLPDGATLTPEDAASIEESIAEIRERSMFDIPELEVDSGDRILALVTCSYELPDARFILFCRELREGETPEAMAQLIQRCAVQK